MGFRTALEFFARADAGSVLAAGSIPTQAPAAQLESPWADTSVLQSADLAALFGVLDSLPVTRSQAVAIPAVARARDLICVTTARLPLYALNRTGRLTPQPRSVSQPEAGRSRFLTMLWTVDDLFFNGWSVWEIVSTYAEDGRPQTFRRVIPGQVQFDTAGNVISVNGRQVGPDGPARVIRFDGPHEGFLSRGAQVVRDARALAAAYAKNAKTPIPAIELHQEDGDPLTEPQIQDLIRSWAAARQGENGGVAYTNKSVRAIPHGQPADNLLVSGRSVSRLDIAHAAGLPAWAVDAEVKGSSLTYSNVPSRWRELIDGTLAGYMEAIATRLSLDDVLAAGTWADFRTDVLTDGDFKDRMEAAKAAVDAGVYRAEEMRAREDGVPLEGSN